MGGALENEAMFRMDERFALAISMAASALAPKELTS